MNHATDLPLVSIGMPVYNEARFIDASLASLRRQDHPNLEIVVCDNASGDDTVAICERHAREDARIRIVRASENHGAISNFQRALDEARGDFFLWAAGHDLWSPNFVSACLGALLADPRACLAFACSRWIDGAGAPLARASGWTDTRGMDPLARFFTVYWGNMHPILGLMRTPDLRACTPLLQLTGGDLVLLSRLSLRGDFAHAPAALWSRREFRAEARYEDKLRRYASKDVAIAKSLLQRMFPLVQLPFALMRVVWRAPLPWLDRIGALLVLLASFPLRYRVGRRDNAR
ncbi:MAG: glycosyltransferase family 2 protein [Lysobacteraceae bacterium]|nr:MAG: glycosyltransferase family 2 protein [Xanthomonadaceae bacterium]